MARPGVTREQVHQVADEIAAEGQNPTVMSVRNRLGGGSPNNITPWLGAWREAHERTKTEVLPQLPEGVEGAMRQVWSIAWKAAQAQFEGERDALATARKDIEHERAEMLTEISRLDGELDEATTKLHAAAVDLASERRDHDQTKAAVREAKALADERNRHIEQQTAELREVRAERDTVVANVARLDADNTHLRTDLERAREAGMKLRQELNSTAGERDRLRGELQRVSAEQEQLRVNLARLSTEVDRERENAKQAKAAIDLGGKKIQALDRELAEERQARTMAERALGELQVEAATLKERAAHAEQLQTVLDRLQAPAGVTPIRK